MKIPQPSDVEDAARRIAPFVHHTPLLTSKSLDQMVECRLVLKSEHLQKTGSFKMRGALNAVLNLNEEAASKGVVTHSSGNHGQALSCAAEIRGIPAYIVNPRGAPQMKKDAIAGYGGQLIDCEPNYQARVRGAEEIAKTKGASFVSSSHHFDVLAGQGTVLREIMHDDPEVKVVVSPVGGGGLLCGSAIWGQSCGVKVYGVEPEGADDAYQSFKSGKLIQHPAPKTIADGLLTVLDERNLKIARTSVADIVLVSDQEIARAMFFLWERMKQIVEPSGAVALAGVLAGKIPLPKSGKVAVLLSGGNLDLKKWVWPNFS